jgi:hypothetical protein
LDDFGYTKNALVATATKVIMARIPLAKISAGAKNILAIVAVLQQIKLSLLQIKLAQFIGNIIVAIMVVILK